ncbi:MAG: collagenase [Bacteroidota bacterium]
MLKTFKRVVLGSLSVLGISLVIWILIALNPNWVYAHQTEIEFITVFHDEELQEGTEQVLYSAIDLIKESALYHKDITIDLCLNDNSFYPKINPLVRLATAYAMLDKTVLRDCSPNFSANRIETKWAVNNHEKRKFDLTWLLAHEFTHNLQYDYDTYYMINSTLGKINWRLEGHAEYISRAYKNDGLLAEKIDYYLHEKEKEYSGLPVVKLENGTLQVLSYLKYATMIQYMMEVEKFSFQQIIDDNREESDVYTAMLAWYKE